MQHKRHIHRAGNCPDPFKVQLRRQFIRAVGIAHRNGQRIHACPFHIVSGPFRIRIVLGRIRKAGTAFRRTLVIPYMPQFSLNGRSVRMGDVRHLLHFTDIFLIGIYGTVVHNRTEAEL